MPPYYDIYGLSNNRDRETIETFLNQFSNRGLIEIRDGQEIFIRKNEKYNIKERLIPISTLTELINFGITNMSLGFPFYIGDNLKTGINHIILKFTFDKKIIFGISIEEKIRMESGIIVDNYPKALEMEKQISELTHATKTSIQFEYPPSDDEEEFDTDIKIWQYMNDEKGKHGAQPS